MCEWSALSPLCDIVSKAFLRSKKMLCVLSLLLTLENMSCRNLLIALNVEWPFLKPCWSSDKRLLLAIKICNLSHTSLSRTLPGSGSKLIGLKLLTEVLSPFLGIGVMVACFQAAGNTWCIILELNKMTIFSEMAKNASFRTRLFTFLTEEAFLTLILFITFRTSSVVNKSYNISEPSYNSSELSNSGRGT